VALNVRLPANSTFLRFVRNPWGRAFLIAFLVLGLAGGAVFTHYYFKYARLIEEKLEAGPFANMSTLYAAPRPVLVGQQIETTEIASYLRQAGYSENNNRSRVGWFRLRPDAIEINPGPDAYDSEGAVIKVDRGRVTEIISLHDHAPRTQYLLEPEPISNLFDKTRQKRRLLRFEDIPKDMVDAVLAAEDKNFFRHAGFDPVGIMRAVWRDITTDRLEGASTITQQLATTLWLGGAKRDWKRKLAQALITIHLEQKLTKEQIFEYYANSIDLGTQGSFWIRGFAQGAQVYFGKDLRYVTLPEAALLAGLPQGPSIYEPFGHKDRALVRRNIVLKAMYENGAITKKEYEDAVATDIVVRREAIESSDAPYFVDLATNTLRSRFSHLPFDTKAYRVYTTLDPDLQREAVEALRIGIEETDKQWKRRNKQYGTAAFPKAQAALVALNAETGEVLALTGGRSYGESQLNRAVAQRQPGSSFKPIVYAAAMNTALDPEARTLLTPASTVVDEPTTFWFDETQPPYEPKNHGDHYEYGPVTLRDALKRSLNVPAVKVAEAVGYDKVAEMARAVGLNIRIQPTPSIALGAYEVTPLEIAGAYTVFANQGQLVPPTFLKSIRERGGAEVFHSSIERKPAVDPRVAYLVENMLEDVLRSGTGAAVRASGFAHPGGGKTGTSRDGWFAGFTSKIIAVVWVGFDDNRDFKLEGAHSALPIWLEFMKRAHEYPQYRSTRPFQAPDGIVTVDIDADTGELAAPGCSRVRSEVFIAGTQPVQLCRLHSRGGSIISSWEVGQPARSEISQARAEPEAAARPAQPRVKSGARSIPVTPAAPKGKQDKPPSRGFLGRLRDLFR
jgi:penicillin-binding protein 1B